MKALNRRGLLRLLPMAPAAAKHMANEIAAEAAKVVAIADHANALTPSASVPTGGRDIWSKITDFTQSQLRKGILPEHREEELRRAAPYIARLREDENIESLLSISNNHRRRMHVESAYRRAVKSEIDNARRTGWDKIWKQFGGDDQ